jgi:CheY-like chemotaxis protein
MASIMLVDARVELHQYILKMLELAEHEVILVSSLSDALQNLVTQIEENQEFLPDLLFVELGTFSVQDALEIHKKVRTIANTAATEIPMVFIVQPDQLAMVQYPFTQAGIKFIVEPTNIDTLNGFLDNLRSVLDRLIKSSVGTLKRKNTTLMANLKEEHLPSLLQMLSLVHASGYATLANPTSKQTGSIHFRYGEITQIILVDPTSKPKNRLEGTDALQHMVEWSEGIFSFGRANPEKMPAGHPMTWVVLRCAKPKE